MKIDIYYINAFTDKAFRGNPAAVCILDGFLSEELMQKIAAQNNLSETAFVVKTDKQYKIRWFAPGGEVKLCGHATLASAHLLFNILDQELEYIEFQSASGLLTCKKENDAIVLDFPARPYEKIKPSAILIESINVEPEVVLGSDDYIVVLKDQAQVINLSVNANGLKQLDRRGVIFTAPGTDVDFVSRVFHPKLGIGEDPVCGSAHCELMPYWCGVFNKTKLHARQLSPRGGELFCELEGDRVLLKGKCKSYLSGKIEF
ncbi:MAG: PhzF family phenazine biosynthesis isomerase [Pseudomonadota bacterium]